MDFFLLTVLCFGSFAGSSSQAPRDVNYACRDGEEYLMCGPLCQRTCENRHQKTIPCSKPCVPGCFCKEGLLRSRNGACITPQECERPICRENEEYSQCGSPCIQNCSNYHEPVFCTQQCRPGCFCKPGFIKNNEGRCILPHDCPIGSCGRNEIVSNCVSPCNNCEYRGKCYYQVCNRGCDCLPGFHRNQTGHCIPAQLCDTALAETLCPKNEHYVPCVNTCNDCWNRGHCMQHNCHPGCDCKPGFFRNEYGECIHENQCSYGDGYCGVNEEYTDCADQCNYCDAQQECRYPCEPGCDCKKGYHRDDNDVCIPAQNCFKAFCKEYEVYLECGSDCPLSCDNYLQPNLCSQQCYRGCFCMQNYVRGPNGKCILPKNCPIACRQNEEYLQCGTACPLTCDNYRNPQICSSQCVSGCFCRSGYVRGPKGTCILSTQCPPVTPVACDVNERYYACLPTCKYRCETYASTTETCQKSCNPGCFCNSGLVKRFDGLCVLPQDCHSTAPSVSIFGRSGGSNADNSTNDETTTTTIPGPKNEKGNTTDAENSTQNATTTESTKLETNKNATLAEASPTTISGSKKPETTPIATTSENKKPETTTTATTSKKKPETATSNATTLGTKLEETLTSGKKPEKTTPLPTTTSKNKSVETTIPATTPSKKLEASSAAPTGKLTTSSLQTELKNTTQSPTLQVDDPTTISSKSNTTEKEAISTTTPASKTTIPTN